MTAWGTWRRVIAVAIVAAVGAGCMVLPKPGTLFEDPPLAVKGTVPLRAALLTLSDVRPAAERRTIRNIDSLPEHVTSILLTDFSEARLFSVIGLDPRDADVLLRGELRSLSWRARHKPLPYIPAVGGTLAELGLPVASSMGDVEIALDVVNVKTDQVIGSYAGSGRESRTYTVFTPWYRNEGDGAFRAAAGALQQAILNDRDRLTAAVGR